MESPNALPVERLVVKESALGDADFEPEEAEDCCGGDGSLAGSPPLDAFDAGESGAGEMAAVCVGLGRFSSMLVRAFVLLLGLGLRLPSPIGLPMALEMLTGASIATSDSSTPSVEVRSAAALSNTDGTAVSMGSVAFDRGVKCGFEG